MGIDEITCATFERLLGEVATLENGPAVLPLHISAVQRLGRNRSGVRESFSVHFHAPTGATLPQQIYPVQHAALGRVELFLVPLGPDARGMQLEAVFNFV